MAPPRSTQEEIDRLTNEIVALRKVVATLAAASEAGPALPSEASVTEESARAFAYADRRTGMRLASRLEGSARDAIGDALMGVSSAVEFDHDLGGEILVIEVLLKHSDKHDYLDRRRKVFETFAELADVEDRSQVVVLVHRDAPS